MNLKPLLFRENDRDSFNSSINNSKNDGVITESHENTNPSINDDILIFFGPDPIQNPGELVELMNRVNAYGKEKYDEIKKRAIYIGLNKRDFEKEVFKTSRLFEEAKKKITKIKAENIELLSEDENLNPQTTYLLEKKEDIRSKIQYLELREEYLLEKWTKENHHSKCLDEDYALLKDLASTIRKKIEEKISDIKSILKHATEQNEVTIDQVETVKRLLLEIQDLLPGIYKRLSDLESSLSAAYEQSGLIYEPVPTGFTNNIVSSIMRYLVK